MANLLNVLEILSRRFSLTLSLFSSTLIPQISIKSQLSIDPALDLLAYSSHGRDSFRLRNIQREKEASKSFVFCLFGY